MTKYTVWHKKKKVCRPCKFYSYILSQHVLTIIFPKRFLHQFRFFCNTVKSVLTLFWRMVMPWYLNGLLNSITWESCRVMKDSSCPNYLQTKYSSFSTVPNKVRYYTLGNDRDCHFKGSFLGTVPLGTATVDISIESMSYSEH